MNLKDTQSASADFAALLPPRRPVRPNLRRRTRSIRASPLVVLLVGAFLAPLDYFIVNLALPAIRTGIGASDAQLQLILSAYASAFAGAADHGRPAGRPVWAQADLHDPAWQASS